MRVFISRLYSDFSNTRTWALKYDITIKSSTTSVAGELSITLPSVSTWEKIDTQCNRTDVSVSSACRISEDPLTEKSWLHFCSNHPKQKNCCLFVVWHCRVATITHKRKKNNKEVFGFCTVCNLVLRWHFKKHSQKFGIWNPSVLKMFW